MSYRVEASGKGQRTSSCKKRGPTQGRGSYFGALLDEFGSPETQDKVAKARKAAGATIVKIELEA